MTRRQAHRGLLVLLLLLLGLTPWLSPSPMVRAATLSAAGHTTAAAATLTSTVGTHLTFTVVTTVDAPDVNPGDGICADQAGQCTLRAATQEADAQPASSIIHIVVPSGSYGLSLGPLRLSANAITLSGAGAGVTTIAGNNTGTVLLIYGTVQANMSGVTLTGGKSAQSGGGIVNGGTLTLTNSTISGNSASRGGGGIFNNNGTLTLTNSTVSGNSTNRGGGIYNTGTLTLTTSTVSGNSSSGGGGGGIFNAGMLTLTTSTVSGNSARQGRFLHGGGIYNTSTLRVTNSTISGNMANSGGGLSNDGTVTLTNSTIAGNSGVYSGPGDGGGGLYNRGILTLTNSTISGNRDTDRGGGIANTGTLTLTTTILARNTVAGSSNDCSGTLTSGGYNLVGIGDGCGLTNGQNGDQVGTSSNPINPLLGPLQDNGGPTLTMALLTGSPAIDTITSGSCTLHSDQRGQPRPDLGDRGACDIGAVEVNLPPQPPSVHSMVPNRGLYTGGTPVVIDGSNLVGPDLTATVRFGDVVASSVITEPSGTIITATSPVTSGLGTVDVTVQTSLGTSPLTPADRYTYGASTLYVATSGSDANTCVTPARPCRTIAYAVAVATSRATIVVAAGTYIETVTIPVSLTLTGTGTTGTIIDGNQSGTVVTVNAGASVAISGATIQNGLNNGINNAGTLTLTNSTISGNTGGGIRNSGSLSVTSSTISGNSAGGIYNYSGTLTVTNSTISGNNATNGNGGGIDNYSGTLLLTDSTVSGNSGGNGAGIFNAGTLTLTDSTVSGNSGGNGAVGGGIDNGGTLTLTNTVLAGNTASNSGPDCYGTLTSGGYNLVGIGDGCGLTNGQNGDQVGTSSTPINPLLGPLQDNGGPTLTLAPLARSPAVDAVAPDHCALRRDQRGRPRPDSGDAGVCDIGAVEVNLAAQPPSVHSVAPNHGLYTGGTVVTIDGSNLVGPDLTSTVRFGDVAASTVITEPSGTVITATSPATSGPGLVDVTVQTSLGTSPVTATDRYTYTSAGTLYVATTGSDANTCVTPASPCRTIGHAIALAASGATISVAAGIYTETVTIPVSLTLTGAGATSTIIDANKSGTVVTINTGATVVISGVTIQNGFTSGNGGGIVNNGTLMVTNSTVSGNSGYYDGGGVGGILNNGTATLTNSTVSSNSGGGILNYYYGTLTLTNSTVSGNSGAAVGSGILNYYYGTLTLTNSTVSGNSAPYEGGGIFNNGTATLTNSTVSGNNAGGNGGGGIYNYSGTVTLTNSIVASNTSNSIDPDCGGTLTSGGNNLVGIGDGCGLTNGQNGDQIGSASNPINPLLGPLQDNGGPTQTMALLAGSPAINKVPSAHCPLLTDQRGQPRPDPLDAGTCDVGAFELQDG